MDASSKVSSTSSVTLLSSLTPKTFSRLITINSTSSLLSAASLEVSANHIPHAPPPLLSSATHLPSAWVALPPSPHHSSKKGRGRALSDYLDDDEKDNNSTVVAGASKKLQREGNEMFGYGGSRGKTGSSGQLKKKSETRSRATVLSDLCGPVEWIPMAKLHFEIVEQHGNNWPVNESKGRPWFGLLTLLRNIQNILSSTHGPRGV
ncbi:PREDICTED: FHA domain-containing protein FHA2-like [Nelumbo nucifera]|uniref:Uncharacterized protein n=2 Tax=Nelumbo nucifera TaxID=4432 RepID=A0A822Y4K0_NELNU|nr:PREDICTED: FHA domain-containing protein FHA2-like [Nelumbo nucifera]DAD25965.1 TPA_asm: hypothetical protein HUJ06_027433 [Nelumbo nucifera]